MATSPVVTVRPVLAVNNPAMVPVPSTVKLALPAPLLVRAKVVLLPSIRSRVVVPAAVRLSKDEFRTMPPEPAWRVVVEVLKVEPSIAV